jgi:hypothetical protein
MAQGDLFAPPPRVAMARVRAPRPADEPDNPERARLRERLEVIAIRNGDTAGGFMLSDVRRIAERAGILTGEEGAPDPGSDRLTKPRALAWLGTLLPALARRELVEQVTIDGRVQYGQSGGRRAHGNKQVLWKLTERGRRVASLLALGRADSMAAAEHIAEDLIP